MTKDAAKLYAALTSGFNPSEFHIYGSTGHHYAFNCRTGKMVGLGGERFSDAVDVFEELIGPYYESRNNWGNPKRTAHG